MIAFQGRSQIKALYGEEAEVLLSAPFTKFLMRTSEPEASKWLAETVGDVELERVRETMPAHIGAKGSHSYGTEQKIEKLLIASEFQGLDDLHGFLKYGNLILKLKLPIMPKRQAAISLRSARGSAVGEEALAGSRHDPGGTEESYRREARRAGRGTQSQSRSGRRTR